MRVRAYLAGAAVLGAGVVLAAAAGGGCSQPSEAELTEQQEQRQELFGAARMRVHPIFTQVKDWNGDDKPDGIEVLLEFTDRFGDPTKAAGTAMFQLYALREGGPELRGPRLTTPWIGSITSAEEQRGRWNRTSRTYSFQLAYPQISKERSYVLEAQFDSASGGRFRDQVVLAGEEEPPTTQPTTKPVGIFGR